MTTQQLKRRYTRVERFAGAWNAMLQVDGQYIAVGMEGTRAEARYFRNVLASALMAVIRKEARR